MNVDNNFDDNSADIVNNVTYSNHYNEEDIYYFDFLNSIIHIIPLDDIIPVSNNIVDRKYASYTCNKFRIIKIEIITYDMNDIDKFKHNMSYYRKNKTYDMYLKYDGPNNPYTFKSNDSDIDKVYIYKSRDRAFYHNMISGNYPKIEYFWKNGYNGIYRSWDDSGKLIEDVKIKYNGEL